MSDICKKYFLRDLYRKIDGAVLTSQNERDLDCAITFQTHSILQRFMLRFDQLQLDCNDHLYIYDGAHAVGSYKVSRHYEIHHVCVLKGIIESTECSALRPSWRIITEAASIRPSHVPLMISIERITDMYKRNKLKKKLIERKEMKFKRDWDLYSFGESRFQCHRTKISSIYPITMKIGKLTYDTFSLHRRYRKLNARGLSHFETLLPRNITWRDLIYIII